MKSLMSSCGFVYYIVLNKLILKKLKSSFNDSLDNHFIILYLFYKRLEISIGFHLSYLNELTRSER